MLLLNFHPGAMGFFLLTAAHAHWPDRFDYRHSRYDRTATNNHYVRPDLFIGNSRQVVESDQAILTDLLGRPSVVLCHNKDIFPGAVLNHVRKNGEIFCLTCNDPEDKIRSNFLYWCKAANNAFDYVREHNSDMDFYQAIYQQLVIYVFQPQAMAEGTTIDFADLGNYESVMPWLRAFQRELALDDPECQLQDWYQLVFDRSRSPLVNYPDHYQDFRAVWREIQVQPSTDDISYKTVLSAPGVVRFQRCMDFFREIYQPS